MKKIVILIIVGMIFFVTSCGTKKQEAKPENPTDNTQEGPQNSNPNETKDELTEEDYKKITSEIESREKDSKNSIVKITYKNESSKDLTIGKVKIIVTRDGKEILSKVKEVNDVISAGTSKMYEIEVELSMEQISKEDTLVNWEME